MGQPEITARTRTLVRTLFALEAGLALFGAGACAVWLGMTAGLPDASPMAAASLGALMTIALSLAVAAVGGFALAGQVATRPLLTRVHSVIGLMASLPMAVFCAVGTVGGLVGEAWTDAAAAAVAGTLLLLPPALGFALATHEQARWRRLAGVMGVLSVIFGASGGLLLVVASLSGFPGV